MRSLALSGLVLLAVACSSPRLAVPEIASIYAEAALDEIRNPVIVIHGILGARLQQKGTGKVVWGAFTSDGVDPATAEGAHAVAVPIDDVPASATSYDPEMAEVYPTGPLGKLELSILYQVLQVDVYAQIIRTLGAGGYTDEIVSGYDGPEYADDHFTCFTFFYDWRRDNVENAIRLGAFIRSKRTEIQEKATQKIARLRSEDHGEEADRLQKWLDDGFRFDIVAHSMGGLVARYFLRYGTADLPESGVPQVTWAGAEEVDRLVMVGTPNFGSIDALKNLYEGFQPSFILPHYAASILGSMPSIYQLLPRRRHQLVVDEDGQPLDLDFRDPAVWEANGWGLFAPSAERWIRWLLPDLDGSEQRRATARRYATWCLERANRFHAAMDSVPSKPCPSQLYLFAADAIPTLTRVRAQKKSDGKYDLEFDGDDLYAPGDMTVPRYSAIADERFGNDYESWLRTPIPWQNVTFLSDDHIGLTRNPHFVDNMLFVLLEQQPLPR